jgi:hypothetical protein
MADDSHMKVGRRVPRTTLVAMAVGPLLSCSPSLEFLGRWEVDLTASLQSSRYTDIAVRAEFIAPNYFSYYLRARGRSSENQGCQYLDRSAVGVWTNTVSSNGVTSLTFGPIQMDTREVTGCQDGMQNRARVTLSGLERTSVVFREGTYSYSVAAGSLILSSSSGGTLTFSRVP